MSQSLLVIKPGFKGRPVLHLYYTRCACILCIIQCCTDVSTGNNLPSSLSLCLPYCKNQTRVAISVAGIAVNEWTCKWSPSMETASTFSKYYMFLVCKCVGHKSTDKFMGHKSVESQVQAVEDLRGQIINTLSWLVQKPLCCFERERKTKCIFLRMHFAIPQMIDK